MITIYTLTYNEQLMIQFMIDHYRSRFPGCRIVVYDSGSTDDTVKIAGKNCCEVRTFSHRGGFNEDRHVRIKNTCWKDARTDWVLMCDVDEMLDINEKELKNEEKLGTTITRSEAYNMVDMDDKLDLKGMKYGARDEGQDKSYLFNKKFIKEIHYTSGCHRCDPAGENIYSKKKYRLYHYCYINYHESIKRFKLLRARISKIDIQNGNSMYAETPEETRQLYYEVRKLAIKVR